MIGTYYRLSLADEDVGADKAESNSIQGQRGLVEGYIMARPELATEPRQEYVDDGYSGTSTSRPAFQRLIQDAQDGKVKTIIVKDFSRFARDYIEAGDYMERIFPLLGVRFISVNDGYDSGMQAGNDVRGLEEEKSRAQELSVREISLIRELTQIRKEHKRELEYEKFDGYELPPRTQFSMLNKPAVSIKYGVMKFNMACIRLFEGIKYVLPILHPNKKRLALIMCPEEDSASVEWARQKDENWVNKDITSLEFVENIFRLMNWNRECRYKVLGRVANSDQGLCMLFDLEEAIMFTPKPQEYTDPLTGEMKKKQMKFFPDTYRNRIGKSYNDYIADHQMNMFEDFIGYQGSAVLGEPVREEDSFSKESMSQESEISENILLPDLAKQSESIEQQSGEIAERGMPT